MPVSRKFAKAVGDFVTSLTHDHQWIPTTVANQVTSYVINHHGHKVVAWLKGHLFHNITTDREGNKSGDHVGDVYNCADGNEYFNIGNKHYRHDPKTDKFYDATP